MEEKTRLIDIIKLNKGTKWLVKAMVKLHRSKVESIVRLFARSIVAESRSHDNSLTGSGEENIAKYSANQISDIDPKVYEEEMKHHYESNKHHFQSFESVMDMDLGSLVAYTADLMANATYSQISLPRPTGAMIPSDYVDKLIDHIIDEIGVVLVRDKVPVAFRQIIYNTVRRIVTYDPVPFYDMLRKEEK